MTVKKLTKREINKLPPAKNKHGDLYFDSELKGFALAAYPSGIKTFFILYGPSTRRRRMVLGQYGKLTPEEARVMAKTELTKVLHGGDPLDTKQAKRKAQTFKEWSDEYYETVKLRKKHPGEDTGVSGVRESPALP